MSDGEFSTVKTKFSQYVKRTRDEDFTEVLDSEGFVKFGQEHMSTPGPKARLISRLFSNLKPSEVRLAKSLHRTMPYTLSRLRRGKLRFRRWEQLQLWLALVHDRKED